MTLGEKRVHLTFNPSDDDKIGQFKRMMADAIDFCNEEVQNLTGSTDGKGVREQMEDINEAARCFSIAMTHLETAQMYAVKGIAKTLKQ